MFHTFERTKKALLFTIAFLAMFVTISSCTYKLSEEEKTVLEAVKHYNSRLRLSLLENDLGYMAAVATNEQLSRLFPIFQALSVEDDYMRAEQQTFEVDQVRLTEDNVGQVDTREKWIFWWQDHQTNEVTKSPAEVTYHMRYNLVLEDGVWKVDKLEDLDPEK